MLITRSKSITVYKDENMQKDDKVPKYNSVIEGGITLKEQLRAEMEKEGLLVEKNDEHTVINQKGRISKIKNEKVECVRLPKAKKEKGAK